MSKLRRRCVILVKEESSYGVDPTLAAANGILVNMSPEIVGAGEKIERDPVRDTLSPLGHVIGAKQYNITMECEGKGGGLSAGVLQAPEIDPLLLACGLQKTSTVAIPVSDASGFEVGETVTGGTSSATGTVHHTRSGWLILTSVSGTFEEGETVTGGTSGGSATVYAAMEIPRGKAFQTGETVTGDSSSSTALVTRIEAGFLIVSGVSATFTDKETITGGTSGVSAALYRGDEVHIAQIEYRPVSAPDSMKSAAMKFYRDGILHTALGCRGSLSIDMTVGSYPKLSMEMQGLYADPSDESMPSPETVDLVPPLVFGIGLTIGDYTPVSTALSVALNNEVGPRKDVNAAEGVTELAITNRRPTGSLDPEADTLANFNPWDAWKAATPAAISCLIGEAPGNRMGVEIPKAVYEEVKYADRDGYLTYELPFLARIADTAGSGDDEFRLTFS